MYASIILILGFFSGSWCGQSLQFLMLYPSYVCSLDPTFATGVEPCTPFGDKEKGLEGFCDQPALHPRVDWSKDTSLQNWIIDMNLACTSKAQIGLIGSMQFVGWMIASCFLPRLSDIYGRKYIFIGSILLQLVSFIALFFSKSAEVTIGIMFFMGFSGVGRCSICFLYLMELLPANR